MLANHADGTRRDTAVEAQLVGFGGDQNAPVACLAKQTLE